MSKISIKTDFADGEKLFAQQLNNNFLVIQAGINANEENLQEVIDQAIIELDHELEEITADRGWDWNGGDRVTFYKGNTQAIEDREIINGQLLYNTDSGETALDDNGTRVVTGSGNVVSISEDEPTNPSTKIWIKPSKMVNYAASYVTNDMSGTDTDKAPSVNAVKNYVDKNVYSTTETVVGTWLDKPLYRKVILVETTTTLHNQGTVINIPLNLLPVEFMTRFDCITMGNNGINLEINKFIVPDRYDNNNDKLTLNVTTNYTTDIIAVIFEYTKFTD